MVSSILKLLDIVDNNPMFLEKFKRLVDRSRLFDNMNAKDTMEINVRIRYAKIYNILSTRCEKFSIRPEKQQRRLYAEGDHCFSINHRDTKRIFCDRIVKVNVKYTDSLFNKIIAHCMREPQRHNRRISKRQ